MMMKKISSCKRISFKNNNKNKKKMKIIGNKIMNNNKNYKFNIIMINIKS
jgi:RecA/RadA recombinase